MATESMQSHKHMAATEALTVTQAHGTEAQAHGNEAANDMGRDSSTASEAQAVTQAHGTWPHMTWPVTQACRWKERVGVG